MHECQVPDCPNLIPQRMLMCLGHWKRVPAALQQQVWRFYRNGQEIPGGPVTPSPAWRAAADEAITAAMRPVTHKPKRKDKYDG